MAFKKFFILKFICNLLKVTFNTFFHFKPSEILNSLRSIVGIAFGRHSTKVLYLSAVPSASFFPSANRIKTGY